jgi:hypothetical protein
MRLVGLAILLFLSSTVARAQNRTVLLASHRAGRVELLDPVTLQSLTSIKVLPQANGVTSKPAGLLFLLDGLAPDFQGCCALYALDLKALKLTKLLEPVSAAVVSPDGQNVLAQRGAVGIEFFGTRSLQHEPGIPRSIAPGNYSLHFSPDGQLLYGTSNFPTPSLDVFDFERRKLVARLSVRQDLIVRGEWVGDDYYLYGRSKDGGQLWRVKPDNSALGEPVKISFPDAAPVCGSPEQELLGAGSRLFLYEAFGAKGDRRDRCARQIPGGLVSIDLQTGRILAHLAPDVHFCSLISSADGKELYGVDVKDPQWTSVGLVRLDSMTGEVLAKRDLASDVWFTSQQSRAKWCRAGRLRLRLNDRFVPKSCW